MRALDAALLVRFAQARGLPSPVILAGTGSTNDDARCLGRDGAPEGTMVVAESQDAGRGRLGRVWQSPAGAGLYLSIVLRPERALAELPLIGLGAAVAVAEAIEEVGGPSTWLKWPNDLLAPDGRKVAGILCEAEHRPRLLVVGVGINVRAAPPLPTAACLAELGLAPEPEALAAAIAARVVAAARWSPSRLVQAWQQRAASGHRVRAGEYEGRFEGIDASGAARIRDDAGVEHRILAGDVELIRPQG